MIVGLLSWYDEYPAWLGAAVTGFGRIVDHVVAVDGAYAALPGGRARSRPDQADAIRSACEAAGVGLTLHQPHEVWHGQEIHKRNFSLALAAPLLEFERDWVMVFDADYHALQIHPERVRHMLATTDKDVATYTLLDGIDFTDKGLEEYASGRHLDHEWTSRTRDVFRWLPNLRYVGTHYTVACERDTKTVWLKGYDSTEVSYLAPVLHLDDALVVHHRTEHRSLKRREQQNEYYERRGRWQLEEHPEVTGAAT